MEQDPYRFFRIEAAELSEQLSRGVLSLGAGAPAEHVPKLLRAAHTLKGAARVVKHRALAERAHALEELLSPLRERAESPASDVVDVLLTVTDAIAKLTRELSPVPAPPAPAARVEEELPPAQTDGAELDAFVEGISEVGVQLRAVRGSAAALERMHHLAALLANHIERALPVEASSSQSSVLASARSIAGELEDLAEQAERAVTSGIDQAERELSQVQGSAERLRLAPCRVIAGALERTVHDTARELGKRVAFVMTGADVRLDAQMLGRARSALVQAVRNAIAHGIELPDERARLEKSTEGTVEVRIERRGNRVVFVCRDDGRGVDVDAIRRAAERSGALVRGASVAPHELIGLLLRGGISTARAVTEMAGRGIGLDIVREAAEALGGKASLESIPGVGTTVELVVPLALSSMDALLVRVGDVVAAVPLEAVKAVLRLSDQEFARTERGPSIVLDGQFVPVVPLEQPLLRGRSEKENGRARQVVVVRGASATAAFIVERLVGVESIVVRGLPALTPTAPVVLGASLDVDGLPRLVLDPDVLVAAALGEREMVRERTPESSLPLLVVDDSLTTRMLERSILESAGYEVELAASAEEALEKVALRRYGLFLVDVEMPGMNGFEFVEKTRSHAVPAILVSSRSSREDLARGREVGASAYVVKAEFDQRMLLDTIRGLVAQ